MKFLAQTSRFLVDLRYILSPSYKLPRRSSLLRTYLRLSVKARLNRFFHYKSEHIMDLRIDPLDYQLFFEMFREVFIRQSYYFEATTDTPTIIDCGGNVGVSTLYFKYLYPKAKITTFEPFPPTFERLKHNIELNKFEDVTVINKGLDDTEGVMQLYYAPNRVGGGSNTIVSGVVEQKNRTDRKAAMETADVQVIRLSDRIHGPIDLLKMDVEGSEGHILKDLDATGKMAEVNEVVFEYHYNVGNPDNAVEYVLSTLKKGGFESIIYSDDPEHFDVNIAKKRGVYHFLIRSFRWKG